MPSIWLFMRYAKKLFSWEVCILNFVEICLSLPYFETIKVLYALQRIKYIMREKKHIDVRFHYAQNVIAKGDSKLRKISTHDSISH